MASQLVSASLEAAFAAGGICSGVDNDEVIGKITAALGRFGVSRVVELRGAFPADEARRESEVRGFINEIFKGYTDVQVNFMADQLLVALGAARRSSAAACASPSARTAPVRRSRPPRAHPSVVRRRNHSTDP